jgi:hypothetical protein
VAGAVMFYNSLFGAGPNRTTYSPTTGAAFFDYTTTAKGNTTTGQGAVAITATVTPAQTVYVADLVPTNTQFRPSVPGLAYLNLISADPANFTAGGFIPPASFGEIPSSVNAQRTVVSIGASPLSTAEGLFAPAVPREDATVAPPEADLAAAVREQLQALGIYARALTPEEKAARELLAAVFVTVPARTRPAESDYQVADARVEDRAVREVIRFALESGLIGEGQSKLDAIAAALANSYQQYSEANPPGEKTTDVLVTEYRDWLLASTGSDAQLVVNYMKSLRATLKKIELLGLTKQELEGSKAQIYGSVLRSRLNVEPEFLRLLVEGVAEDIWAVRKPSEVLEPKQASLTPAGTPDGVALY